MRDLKRALLQPLLQLRLRVLRDHLRIEAIEMRRVQPQDQRVRRVDAAVQVNRTEDRFQRIRQNRIAIEAAALQLTAAERERVTERQLARELRERLLLDQAGAQPRQLAFGEIGKAVVQLGRAGETEN